MSPEREEVRDWLDEINWSAEGLVAAVVQDDVTHRVLMSAWMNREAVALTVAEAELVELARQAVALDL